MRFGRRERLLIAIAVAPACGRVHFDPLGNGTTDGALGDSTAPACQQFSAWGTPQPIAETVGGGEEYGGQILPDGLTLYFDRHGATNEIFVTHRPDRVSAWETPQSLGLGTATGDCCATPSADELELYFERNTGTVCIYRTTRTTTTQSWGTPAQVAPLCTSANEGAYLSIDGLSLYYSTDVSSMDVGTIMVTTRASTAAAFTTAGVMVNGIAANPLKGYPALSVDGLSIYFESAGDLWEATRPSLGGAFGTPAQIPGINSASGEQDVSITGDGLELYFASARVGGQRHLYVAKRTCL